MATDSDMHGYINAVEQVFASALMVTIFPWLNWVLRLRVLKASFPSEKDPLGLGKILGLTLLISRGEQLTYFLMALRRRLWHGGLVRTRRDSEICLVLSSPTDSTRKKPSRRLSCRCAPHPITLPIPKQQANDSSMAGSDNCNGNPRHLIVPSHAPARDIQATD
jgi:hypothetical protein